MSLVLKNSLLEILVDLPHENYQSSRFDWTGKISEVKYRNIPLTTTENAGIDDSHFGKGLYNEFGIDSPLGFEEAKIGGLFHKIGIGLLKKEDSEYQFSKPYEIQPANFEVVAKDEKLSLICTSALANGYSYILKKVITLNESVFSVNYHLYNTGKKPIITSEYTHNFLQLDTHLVGDKYKLTFPFQINEKTFDEVVNPEKKVVFDKQNVHFKNRPTDQFFFSNLSGSTTVKAHWELLNLKSKIGLSETGNFQTNKINLWGWQHVISPELFFNIALLPGESVAWARTYELFAID